MLRRLFLFVGLAGSAYSLYSNTDQQTKTKVGQFIRRTISKLSFRDLLAILKK